MGNKKELLDIAAKKVATAEEPEVREPCQWHNSLTGSTEHRDA